MDEIRTGAGAGHPSRAGVVAVGREVRPVAYPRDEVRAADFRVVEVAVPRPGPGEVLVRNTWTSVDAALRLRLRERAPEGYFPAFPLDQPMDGIMTVGEVVESRADGFAPGDTVSHASGWRDYAVVGAGSQALGGVGALTRLDVRDTPPQAHLGVLGATGLTAYAGLFHVAELRDGDVVWVSAAAGAVGGLVAQLAKLHGHRVIGSAGSAEKVRHLREELGLDAAFNYKDGPLPDLLREAAPDGIDVYFDNVGGDHLEAALGALRTSGRVAICGMISEYAARGPSRGPGNLMLAVTKNLTIRGFRGSAHTHLLPEVRRRLGAWVREGRLPYRETVVDGLEQAPAALAALFRGDNTGKTLVRIDGVAHRENLGG
ncbi:NADP-dependent oxidoreductase [Streptomyces phaeolivaceus]|uniref:NADP-dependent oxidoreductase n=1 Tax=Streptomyces phaeolivaceus TaxID=2653200 RepID=A0A5P8JXE0_9ACTN|nr:NADP-dependent oxidoreductase [Streptomyces phaeolivaceus]QFQ95069.1 NADP-dependent oxidoreductase [Streptomyces phaeolivaceus]